MRIISKFKDYYDGAQSLGQDRNLVYLRATSSFDLSRDKLSPDLQKLVAAFRALPMPMAGRLLKSYSDWAELYPRYILLAGKLYPLVVVAKPMEWGKPSRSSVVTSMEEVVEYFEEYERDMDMFKRKQAPKWEAFFGLKGDSRLAAQAVALATPVIHFGSGTLELNPELASSEFYKVLDAWTTFQEISMFMGNLANPDNTPVTISDKDRIVQHGFDEYSFRKPPQKVR